MAHFELLERHLLDEILVFANLIQIPAVILTGGVAWFVCRPLRRWVRGWAERVPEHHHLDWVVSHRSWVTDRLVPLITPVAWARLKAVGQFGVPKTRALFEATYFAGLRKAGMPEE